LTHRFNNKWELGLRI